MDSQNGDRYSNIKNKGYIQADKVPNQQSSAAIMGVRKWAAKFGFPYKVISDLGGGLRDDFINHL